MKLEGMMKENVSRIGNNPLDFIGEEIRPLRVAPAPQATSVAKTYRLPPELIEKVADIAYAERCGVSALVVQAIRELVTRLETRRGDAYPRRPECRERVPSTLEAEMG